VQRGAEVKVWKCRGAEVQRCRYGGGAEQVVQVQRAEVHWWYRGAEVVQSRCRGAGEEGAEVQYSLIQVIV